MICPPCKVRRHSECKRGTWCDCQHKQPVPAQSALFPINQLRCNPDELRSAILKAPVPEINMTPDPWAALAHAARQRDVQLQSEIDRLRPQALRVYDDEYGDRMAP